MAMKDISDEQVCRAVAAYKADQKPLDMSQLFSGQGDPPRWPYERLQQETGQPEKVCFRAMERAHRRGLIEYGVSLRSGWLTEKGQALVNNQTK